MYEAIGYSAQSIAESFRGRSCSLRRWEQLADLDEGFLKQKSKLHWLKVGDRNNAYFHRSTQIRKMRNSIREIVDNNRDTLKTGEEIKGEAERFFKDFFTHIPVDFQGMTVEELQEIMEYRCTEVDQDILVKEVSEEEITKVLFSMPSNKAPGLDRYTSEFFKAVWSFVRMDFIAAIKSFFDKGFLPKGLNSTILSLIPKKRKPE